MVWDLTGRVYLIFFIFTIYFDQHSSSLIPLLLFGDSQEGEKKKLENAEAEVFCHNLSQTFILVLWIFYLQTRSWNSYNLW